ncbi:MAG TPA: multicopper oxidase family protein [Aestuariivirgaceae bacterium]|nr:multicopper oxidase family protein [Aestuariivirgaceae bacterium]
MRNKAMSNGLQLGMSRRAFAVGAASFAAGAAMAPVYGGATEGTEGATEFKLTAKSGRAALVGLPYPDTPVWAYNTSVPGPTLAVRQGDRIRVAVENGIPEETTIHWHGIRLPNAMDGVPHLTQKPIAPGESFVYEFDVPDAGTYWYHPHQRSFEQMGRGLSGALIVEERQPVAVDRDVVWLLDDWRLQPDASISEDFGNFHDVSHNGRLGNTVTVNGRVLESVAVRRGERLRLRLVNAANARIFGLEFRGHRPTVIAYDGQPVEPHEPEDGRIIIGPAMRVDLILDMAGQPGARFTVVDSFYQGQEYRLLDLRYEAEPLRHQILETPVELPPNTMPEPDLNNAEHHDITFGGGMMGGMTSATMDGREVTMGEMMRHGMAWAVNGVAATGHVHEPILTLERGRSCVLALDNDTAWHHPIHLHGHSFRVISRNGQPTRHREWQDTVMLDPRERAEIAFVADNPGDWMLHCHILEHQSAGMMSVIRVR